MAIEQDWRIRKLIRANLEALGLEVQEAVNRQHGLQLLHANRPDLILLDLDLPDVDAMQLLRDLDLQFRAKPVPVVLMSAEPLSRHLMWRGQEAGHLLKPFSASDLLEQVQKALDSQTNSE